MKTRNEEIEELLIENQECLYAELSPDHEIDFDIVNALIDKRVKLEIEKHDLERK